MDVDNSLVEQSFHLERLSVSIKIIDRAMASSSPSLVGHFRLSRRREPLSSSFFFFAFHYSGTQSRAGSDFSAHSTYLHTVMPKGFCPICDCPFVRSSLFFILGPLYLLALSPLPIRPFVPEARVQALWIHL